MLRRIVSRIPIVPITRQMSTNMEKPKRYDFDSLLIKYCTIWGITTVGCSVVALVEDVRFERSCGFMSGYSVDRVVDKVSCGLLYGIIIGGLFPITLPAIAITKLLVVMDQNKRV